MNNKAAITSTIGYMCLALTGWMVSMPNAGWFEVSHGHGTAMLFPMSVVLIVMGILSFVNERTLDAIIFFGGAGLFWAGHQYVSGSGMEEPLRYTGWYWFIWAVFFCYVWLGSFSAGLVRMLFLLGLWLTLLALAIGDWIGSHGFMVLGGYLGLATSILAAISSAMSVIPGAKESVVRGAAGQPA
jgi:uncharacterized protein